jgi:hypothetical protein
MGPGRPESKTGPEVLRPQLERNAISGAGIANIRERIAAVCGTLAID